MGLVVLQGLVQPLAAQSEGLHNDSTAFIPIDPIAYLTGRFRPSKKLDFALLPKRMTDGSTVYLRTEVVDSLTNMIAAAAQAGLKIYAVSGMRSYDRQKKIWERRLKAILAKRSKQPQNNAKTLAACKTLLKYTLPPGLTRHHWGTDVDLVTTKSRFWQTRRGKRQLKWLAKNSARYGFYMVYNKGRPKGVSYEPWHWSFAPLAQPLMAYYLKSVKTTDLGEFTGRECLDQMNWKEELLGWLTAN